MLLVVAMLLSLTGTVTYAADNALTVSAGAVTVDVSTDKTVTIPVTVKNNPGFAVGGFNVEYDTTALTFTSAELVADFTNISTNKKTPGNIGVFVERDKNYTEDGVLLNLKFTVTDSAQNGEYSVKLVQNDMYEFINWDTVTTITNVNFVSGSVTVSGVVAQSQVTSLVLKKATTDTDLTELKLSISKVGTVYSSSVRAEFEAEEGADTTVTWESSNENVAAVENKVNTSGKNFCRITTKGLGTAIITAHCGALTASFTLTISAYDSTEMTVASEEGSRYISFTLKSDDTAAPTVQLTTKPKYDLTVLENVQWTSSNENVATVNESGLVTVTGIGSAEISATGTCAGSGTVAKGTASITASPDSSELPTITVKRGDKVISDRSGYNAEELILPIGSTVTLKAEQSKTSFTWLGKTYSYKLAANTDWVYSDPGATGTVTVKDNGEIRVTAASYSTAGKKLAIKVYAEGASDSYVYCAFRLIAKTGLTQAEDGYFEIYNANDLKEFADLVNNTACTNAIGGQPEKNLNLRLMNDIDMTSINDTYIPIGSAINGKFGSYASSKYYSWCGDFDGNGHRIYNIDYTAQNRSNVTQWDNSGVIFTTAGSCRDLTVEGKVKTASNWTGALCGVGQCSKYENVISKLEINAGKASSVSGIGGSDQRATFKNCVNYSNIISNSEAKYSYVGGIALEGAVVENCQNYGRLESTNPNAEISGIVQYSRAVGYVIKISQCANYGEIIGAKAAGIVADFEPRGNGSVVDCYNWGEIKGSVYAGGVIGRVDLQAYGNSLKMSGCYNYGTVASDDSSATLGELIGKISLGRQTPTNSVEKCFYNEDSGNDAIGTIANSSSIVYEAPEFTAISQNDFATLAEKLGEKFQNSCPAPVFTWQQAKGHAYGTVVTYVWHLNTETGAYDACTASVECTECGSKLSQALTVEREVARTDCTKERTVTYTATGTINGVAADGTQTDILPAGTHEVNSAKWASDGDAHWHVCANCNVRVDETAHTNNGWKTDANNHWHECTVCGSSYDLDKHSGGTATAVKKAQCKACGQEYGELALPTQDKDGYYLIHNADELLWFRNTVNAGQNTIKGRLANDIDMTGACENWVPIGNHYNKYPFKGTFDGAGKTIRNFDVTSAGGSSGFGLFGVAGAKPGYGELAKNTVIKNFTLEGSITVTGSSYGSAVGGVLGDARGYVKLQDITVNMTITASGGSVGGILGFSDNGGNAITNCHNLGNIEGSGNSVGGIAGYMRNYGDSVSDCSNEGTVNGKAEVGGIVGFMCGSVSRCINYAEITGTGDQVGGIVGSAYGTSNYAYREADIISCANVGAVNGAQYVGGIAGGFYVAVVWNCYNTADITGTKYVGGIVGGDDLSMNGKLTRFKLSDRGVPQDSDLENCDSIKNVYNTGTVNGDVAAAIAAQVRISKARCTNAFYATTQRGIQPFGDLRDDIKDNFKAEPLTTASEAVLTTKPDNLTDSMKKNNWFFQASCPYPVLEWQEAEEHVISDEVIFDWTQDSATGLYSACVAKKLCQNCDYALSATLNVTRTVIREATTTQTGSVLYTATGYLEGKAVLDTKLVEMDKLTDPQVTELKLNKTSDTVTIGADAKEFADILFATVTAEEGADTTVYWFSGNTDLATVAPASADNHKCVITAKAAGTVTITASCGSKVVTFQLTILRNASGLTVTGPGGVTGKTLYMRPTDKKASTVQLTVTVQPEDATGIITWRSLDESVAMVDKNGLVTITGLGETTIEAKITNPDGTEITATFPIKCRTATAAKLKFYHDGKQVSADYTYSITKDLVMNLAGGETLYLDVEINPETFEWMGKTFKQPLPALTAYDSKQEGWLILQWVTEGEHAGQLAITNTAPGKNLTDKMLIKALIPGYESFSCVYFGVKLVDGTYTVNFDANGGEGAMTSQTLTYGKTSESLKANAFTKPGYTFAGWNTAADGTGTAYTNRQTTPNVTTENGGAVTLYAQWTANSYTVKFDGNGAEGTMADQSFTYDAEQALTANGFTKTGYTFAGWKLDDTTYEDGATVKNLATEGALTLTAQWTANSYTVKFDGNGAEGTMADQSFTYDVEQALTANGFTKTGYTFAGWKLDDTTYEDGATVKNLATSEEITLIAQWTAIKKDDGASTGDSGIIAWGAAMPVAVLAAAYVIGRKKREE